LIRYGPSSVPSRKTAENISAIDGPPLIIRELYYGPRSYGDFLATIPADLQKTMLAQRLKELAGRWCHSAQCEGKRARGHIYVLTGSRKGHFPSDDRDDGRMGAQVGRGPRWFLTISIYKIADRGA